MAGFSSMHTEMFLGAHKIGDSRFDRRYNLRLCWQTPVCQILVRDGEPPKLGFKGPISLDSAAGTFLEN